MILSKLYIWIVSFFKSVINLYDGSLLCNIIERTCNFFGRKFGESFFVNTFSNKKGFNERLKNSLFFALLCAPFKLIKKFYYINEEKINSAKANSTLLSFFKDAKHMSARQIGLLMFWLGLGMLVGAVSFWELAFLNILTSALVLISGLVLVCAKSSLASVAKNSFVLNYIRQILFSDCKEDVHTIYNMPFIKTVCMGVFVLSLALSYVSVYAPLLVIIGIALLLGILLKPVLGIYIMALGTALLPTMANVFVVAITFVSYILHLAFDKHTDFKPSCFSVVIFAFLLFMGLGALVSVDTSSSIMVFAIYLVFTLGFTLVTNIVKSKKQWCITVALFAISSFIVSVYGIIQNFTLDSTTQSWVDPTLFSDITTRVYSTLSNPNVLGQFLILTIPVILSCILHSIKCSMPKKTTAMYLVFILSGFTCLIFTWSRSAWVGVMLSVVLMLCIYNKRWIALCVAALFVMPLVLPESILSRLTSIGNTEDTSTTYRIAVWTSSINMIRDYPLCGIGLGSDAFLKIYTRYALSGADFALHAHNFYLQWIVDVGVWGLIIFVSAVLTAYGLIASVKDKHSLMRFVCIGLGCGLIGYLFQGMAETQWYNYKMVLIFWFCLAIIQTASDIDEALGGGTDD
jgi:putative inorganic carbon (HCO3(-)) transporter